MGLTEKDAIHIDELVRKKVDSKGQARPQTKEKCAANVPLGKLFSENRNIQKATDCRTCAKMNSLVHTKRVFKDRVQAPHPKKKKPP